MGSEMDGCKGEGSRINSFALVSYLPEPLGGFLDRLRSELVRESHAKAHLTLLPPRPILCPADEAWQELKARLQDFPPFRVELEDIEIFPVSQVIYVSVGLGRAELERMHYKLNAGGVEFREPFSYHPHVTVTQDLEPETVAAAAETAARCWREFPHRRDFLVDRLTFVQNTLDNRWIDLARSELHHSNISI
jgi:2'-5' RNA ligase